MTITREQIADLRKGDVVTLTSTTWPEHTAVSGVLMETSDGQLVIRLPDGSSTYVVRDSNGYPMYGRQRSLTVVKKAPRPFYANSDQLEPEPGDIAQDPNGEIRWASHERTGTFLVWWHWSRDRKQAVYTDTVFFTRHGQLTLLGRAAG